MAKVDITAERLRELLDYDAETGTFRWRHKGKGRMVGSVAGCRTRAGYVQIRTLYVLRMAHRLAWLYVYGRWPRSTLDHIDGDRLNNRIANLREVSVSGNAQNQKGAQRDSLSGYLGVVTRTRATKNRWQAKITVDGRSAWLGVFDSPECAHLAYLEAKRRLHPCGTI